jgi:hypothetical protein
MNNIKLEELADECVGICDSDLHEGITNKIAMEAHQRKKIFKIGYEKAEQQTLKRVFDIIRKERKFYKNQTRAIHCNHILYAIKQDFGIKDEGVKDEGSFNL